MKAVLLLLLAAAGPILAQDTSPSVLQRGYFDFRSFQYPQAAPNDSGHIVGESLFRYEASYRATPALRLFGSIDARTDSHRQFERGLRVDWQDRSIQRPALSLRRFSAVYHRDRFTVEAGRQFIRWGKADILNPTDRFAPRDFLNVANPDYLAILAGRVTYETASDTVEFVWAPRFTPSRTPLLNQRWTVLPSELQGAPLIDLDPVFPSGPQFGARWNHLGSGYEFSLSFHEGFNHLPLFEGRASPAPVPAIEFRRFYPQMRMYGADAAVPLRWFTIKGEAGYFRSRDLRADEYVIYVAQLERQLGEWSFVGGYAGEAITLRRNPLDFAPDRGLTRSFLGRAAYTIDASRSIAIETAIRQDGRGSFTKLEYSHLLGQHWRATAGAAWLRGDAGDFLGQFRRNSLFLLGLRYSF
ncbi:MAG: hypothetical protein ACK5AZ_08940 [Bryobacteraceae bacterium]